MKRRNFVITTAIATISLALPASAYRSARTGTKIKAIIFDGFPIFSPMGVYKLVLELFPEKGKQLIEVWRTRQFEYTWLKTLSADYQDFMKVTEDALMYAAAATGVAISDMQRRQLLDKWLQLDVWPEVPTALQQLKNRGYRLGILTNFSQPMLDANAAYHHLSPFCEHLISIDLVKKYKPSPETYQLGPKVFDLKKEEILYVAFAGWDAAGAKQFGHKTYWVNRLQTPPEQLGLTVDGAGKDLNDLLAYLK